MSEDEPRRGLVQAPVAPLDADGVQAARLGMLVWLVAAVVLELRGASWWWVWTCWSGALLGAVGVWYTTRRRGRSTR